MDYLQQASGVAGQADEIQTLRAATRIETVCTGMRYERTYDEGLDYLRANDAVFEVSRLDNAGTEEAYIQRKDLRGANAATQELENIVEATFNDTNDAVYTKLERVTNLDGTESILAIGEENGVARRVKLDAETLAEQHVAEYTAASGPAKFTDVAIDELGNEYLVGYASPLVAAIAESFIQVRDATGAVVDTFTFPSRADQQYIKRIAIHDGDFYMMHSFDAIPTSTSPIVSYSTAEEMADWIDGVAADLAYADRTMELVNAAATFNDMVKTNDGLALVGEYTEIVAGGEAIEFYGHPLVSTMDDGNFVEHNKIEGTFDRAKLSAIDHNLDAVDQEELIAVAWVDGEDSILKVGVDQLEIAEEIDMTLAIDNFATLNSISVDEDSLIYVAGMDFDPVTGETFSATAIMDRNGFIHQRDTTDFKEDYTLSIEEIVGGALPDPGPKPGG